MPNLKDKFSKLLGGVVGRGSASVLGVDVSSSSIKVVQLKRKGGRAVLETYGELALGPYAKVEAGQATNLPPDIIADGLRDVLREAKVTTKESGVAVPLSSSLITVIEVPNVDEKQLNTIIPIEARKYIPVPISDVLLDWSIVPVIGPEVEEDNASQKLSVLIVAIHKETISKYQKIIQDSGLNASFFEIEIFSTIRAILDRGITPVMVIDFGVGTTKLYIIEAGIVRSSHTVNQGSQDITRAISRSMGISMEEAEEMKRTAGINQRGLDDTFETTSAVLEFIFAEAKRVIFGYEKKYKRPVTKIVFAGGGSLLKGLKDAASERFDMDVEIANPFRKVETPAFLENILIQAGPEFAVAIGTALRKLEELS